MSIPTKHSLPIAIGAALLFAGTVARADEPGPGGSKTPKPVTGDQVYQAMCQACHMADAKGATGAATIPALAASPTMASGEYIVTTLVTGRGAMPSFNGMLSPEQIAAVATHVRTHFGNKYKEPVTVAEVKRIIEAAK